MTYIIHGATGAQGAPLLRRLLHAGKYAVAGVRRIKGLSDAPCVHLDNASVDALVAAYRGADGVFVHLPQTLEADRVMFARNIVKAVELAKPGRVVISTSGNVIDEPGSPLQAPADSAVAILIDGVQQAGVSTAVIAPRLYLENLLMPMIFGAVRDEGVLRYPVRADFPVSWSSHLDVAEVAECLLVDSSITGVIGVGHLPGLIGADLAEGFAHHLGSDVVFEKLSPLVFGALIRPFLGSAADAVEGLYQVLTSVAASTISPSTSAQELLGLEPRGVKQWLNETLS